MGNREDDLGQRGEEFAEEEADVRFIRDPTGWVSRCPLMHM
jgi:hypothetical protein